MLLTMIFVQAGICGLLGSGFGMGICGIIGQFVASAGYPFRMMWFTPLIGSLIVVLVSIVAAAISARPVLKLQPAVVFAGR
jgi:putative ABC transport system permease protein